MSQKKVSMSKVREIIRLYEETGLNYRKIGRALKISHPVVSQYITDFKEMGLRYADIEDLSDTDLLELLERKKKETDERYRTFSEMFEYFAKELKRTGVNEGFYGKSTAESILKGTVTLNSAITFRSGRMQVT